MKLVDIQNMKVGELLWLNIENVFVSDTYLRTTIYAQASDTFCFMPNTQEGYALYIKRIGPGLTSKDFIIDLKKSHEMAGTTIVFQKENVYPAEYGDIIFYFKNAEKTKTPLKEKSVTFLKKLLEEKIVAEDYEAAAKIRNELNVRLR